MRTIVDSSLLERETLVSKVCDSHLYHYLVGELYRCEKAGIDVCDNDVYLVEHIAIHYVHEIFLLTHVKEGEIHRIVYMSETIDIREP